MLGALCGVTAVVFVVWSKISGEWFKSLRKNAESPVEDVLLPAIGGITTGTLALLFPEIMYQVGRRCVYKCGWCLGVGTHKALDQ